ncbi:MAG: Gx transporter family protein [Spirochaetia bacterium]
MQLLTEKYRKIAFFTALCMTLSAVEYLIPKPVPFLRIGLANLPLILGLGVFTFPQILLLALMKILAQSLIHGTLFSYPFLFSFFGTYASVGIMFLIYHLPDKSVSLIGVSLAGALASNSVQLVLSMILLFGSGAYLIAPLLFGIGTAGALLLGVFAEAFRNESKWYTAVRNGRE